MKKGKEEKKKKLGSVRIPISTRVGGVMKDKKRYTRKIKHKKGGKG